MENRYRGRPGFRLCFARFFCILLLVAALCSAGESARAESTAPVSFITYDGRITAGSISEYTEGRVTPLPTAVEKTGYVFSGWYTNPAYFGEPSYILPKDAEGEKIFYACWTSVAYSIAYDGNGSTAGTMEDTEMNYREAKRLSENAYTRAGWHFTGWNTEPDGSGIAFRGGQFVNCLTADPETIVLYAQWEPDPAPIEVVAVTPSPTAAPVPTPVPTPTPAPTHGPILAQNEVVPYGNLKEGEPYSIAGTYTAQGCNLSSVRATVTSEAGSTVWFYAQDSLGRSTFDVGTTINQQLRFGALPCGNYTYSLCVTDELGSTKEISSVFSIVYVPLQGPCGAYLGDGQYSTEAYFTLFEDGELVIEGTGGICSGKPQDLPLPWESGKSMITRVSFLGEFSSIPENAFASCPKLTTLSFPSGVGVLGERAAADCAALRTVFFSGSAPSGSNVFPGVTAEASYPCNDPTWTIEVQRALGGDLLWVPAHRYVNGICILCGDSGDKPATEPGAAG